MKDNKQSVDDSRVAKNVMSKIMVMREYLKAGSVEKIEEYYKKHGTYSGIEEYIKSIENHSDESNR